MKVYDKYHTTRSYYMSNVESMRNILNSLEKVGSRQTLTESKSKRHPLDGHKYHEKTDAELKYIIKDAGEAADAMKDHDSNAHQKYLDQILDAETVLGWRKTHGIPDWYAEKYKHKKKVS